MGESQALDYASPGVVAKPRSQRGKGFLALCGNLALPGLGYFIAGRRRRAVVWFAVFEGICLVVTIAMCVPALVPALIVLLPVYFGMQLWVLIDGYRTGRRSEAPMLGRPIARYGLGVGIVALAMFFAPNLLFAYYIRDHWVEAFKVPTAAMSPTIQSGDRIVAHKRAKWQRWSVVVFVSPESAPQRYLKRIIGLPGETVELVGDEVHINGKSIALPPGIGPYQSKIRYPTHNGCEGSPMKLGPDEYYVLGDNSPISGDSRYWRIAAPGHQAGAVPESSIIGVATWVYWPPSRWHRLTVSR